jgi:hypothetical protein
MHKKSRPDVKSGRLFVFIIIFHPLSCRNADIGVKDLKPKSCPLNLIVTESPHPDPSSGEDLEWIAGAHINHCHKPCFPKNEIS